MLGAPLILGGDQTAPEPVGAPHQLHLLNGHPLGLRQQEHGVQRHDSHPECEEEVHPKLHTPKAPTSASAFVPYHHPSPLLMHTQEIGYT